MSKEAILKIKRAEAEADKIRTDAAETAKDMVRRAEAEGKRLCEKTEADALRINQEKLRATEEKIDMLLEEKRAQTEKEMREKVFSAELNMREAIKTIVGEVMDQCQ